MALSMGPSVYKQNDIGGNSRLATNQTSTANGASAFPNGYENMSSLLILNF